MSKLTDFMDILKKNFGGVDPELQAEMDALVAAEAKPATYDAPASRSNWVNDLPQAASSGPDIVVHYENVENKFVDIQPVEVLRINPNEPGGYIVVIPTPPAAKQTSPELSKKAGAYMRLTEANFDKKLATDKLALLKDIRSLAASVVSQDEKPK